MSPTFMRFAGRLCLSRHSFSPDTSTSNSLNSRRFLICAALLPLFAGQPAAADENEVHEWTSKNGYKVMAAFVRGEREDNKSYYILRRQDTGQEIRIAGDALEPKSRLKAMSLDGKRRKEEAAREHRRVKIEAVKNFSYNEVGFDTTEDEFKKRYPSVTGEPGSDPPGTTEYMLPSQHTVSFFPHGKATGAAFCFADRRLLSITVMWLQQDSFADYRKGLDNWRTLTKSMAGDFGKADARLEIEGASGSGLEWIMPETKRRLQAHIEFDIHDDLENVDTLFAITVTNMMVEEEALGADAEEKAK